MINKVTTNRKTTRGRKVYFQKVNRIVKDKDGIVVSRTPIGRTIKHIQESARKLKRDKDKNLIMQKFVETMQRKFRHIPSNNPRTIYKKQQKNREVLIWNSSVQGTFVGNLKETFKF